MIIYKATNNINNKIYIGQSIRTLSKRKRAHKYDAKEKRTNMYFHNGVCFFTLHITIN